MTAANTTTTPGKSPQEPEGLRERKRRETLARITASGVRLFLDKGYEATTVDDISREAGISRRTFFHYFESKDDILLSLQSGVGEMLAAAVRSGPDGQRPLQAIRAALLRVCAPIPADEMIALDRLMRSSSAVQARKQASYIQHEQALFEALRARWPQPDGEMALRLTAMMAIGAMRLSFDRLNQEGGKRPIAELLNETFDALESGI